MATRHRSTAAVKHGVIYAPFRKALEALGDWRRDVTVELRPEVGTNFHAGLHPYESRRYVAPVVTEVAQP